ncbi:hypothetical protein Pcinc_006650 [Petrolisthes cinctipes]|uniref:Uncharacterized protein n=1 Tax=Petrolisthes cinctipes TaxID=88211 RepID=A0AAE1GA39_PETCI|nr:hypothetical protein Pcinc_006650 [Petrolisthes cinctipes]
MKVIMIIYSAVLLWPILVHCEGRRVNDQQTVIAEQELLVVSGPEDDEAMLLSMLSLGDVVGELVDQQQQQHTTDCHLLLLTSTPHSPFVSAFLRQVGSGVMLIEVKKEKKTDMKGQQQQLQPQLLPETVWGNMKTTCRTLVLHLTPDTNTTNTLRMVEEAGLWNLPETRVVVIGDDTGTDLQRVLLHSTFRNTIHALYFAVHPSPTPPQQQSRRLHFNLATHTAWTAHGLDEVKVKVWSRCLYCQGGKAEVQVVYSFSLTSPHLRRELDNTNLFSEHLSTFHGHRFTVTTVSHFPYIDYLKNEDQPGASVTLVDSIDTRLFNALSPVLNFTYEIREEPERSWGLKDANGQYSGIVGQLQREEVDLCTLITISPERLRIMSHARAYPSDKFTVVSLKPALLPKYLSIVRPFSSIVWSSLVIGAVVFGLSLLVIQWVLMWVINEVGGGGGGGEEKDTASTTTTLLFIWGSLVSQSSTEVSENPTGRMLAGWWLVFCLVIIAAFRSSLIAHLTVQGREAPIETFEDMITRPGWEWALESWTLKGIIYDYFSKHPSPVVQHIFREMESLSLDEAVEKILQGSYSFITFKNQISIKIASFYTDSQGQTPLYISVGGVFTLPDYGWGFRKGAPFYRSFQHTFLQFGESGIVNQWFDELMASRVKTNREAAELKPNIVVSKESENLALGLNHLQGAFYILFMGFLATVFTLLVEVLVYHRQH